MVLPKLKIVLLGYLFFLSNLSYGQDSKIEYGELSLLDVIKISLENNNNLKITEIFADISFERIEVQEGQFDSQIQGSGRLTDSEVPFISPFDQSVIDLDNEGSSFSAGVQRRMKSSPLVNVTLTSDSTGDRFEGQEFNQAANTVLGLTVTVPLWRGRGSYLTTLPLELAKIDFEASSFDLKHQIDISILQSVTNYWNYRGSRETLKLLRDSEERSRVLTEEIQALINADELPKSELNVVKAQLSRRKGSRLRGELSVIDAKAALATNLGIVLSGSTEDSSPITELAEPGIDRKLFERLKPETIMENVVKIRNDFSALDSRIVIANKQIELAENETKPSLNVVVGGNYTTFKQDDQPLGSFGADRYGPNWSVQLSYVQALRQTSAKANQRIAVLGLSQRQVERSELQRATTVDLNATLFAFIQSDRRYSEARDRYELSMKNVSNERKKLLMGSSTILDVLNVEDQLLQAEIDVIQERVSYGSFLVRLLFVSGHLGGVANNTIVLEDLRTEDGFIDAVLGKK